ncbi:MAG: peptidylprolyl isomerase [Phycisphaerales bacterium]|nr:MAG: peptidylprolyl isomerase [Phycisphaerales bacterium]
MTVAAASGLTCVSGTDSINRPDVTAEASACVGVGGVATLTAKGDIVPSYLWSLERRPEGAGDVEFADPKSDTTTASGFTVEGGQYIFRVIVTDYDAVSASSWVTVTVDGPPGSSGAFCVEVAGPESLTVGQEGTYSATPDAEGEFSYAWEVITTNGPPGDVVTLGPPDEAETTAVAAEAGSFIFRATVTSDDTGEVGSGQITVVITEAPELGVTIEGPESGVVGTKFELSAVVEEAIGNLAYEWRVTSGEADLEDEDQATVGVTPTAAGTVELEVEVTDEATGQTAGATHTVSVAQTEALQVSASSSSPLLRVGDEVTLSASVEGDSDTIDYAWEVLDGPGTIANPTVAEATLTATAGATIRVQVSVTVPDETEARTGSAEVVVVSYEAESGDRPEVAIAVQNIGTVGLALEVDAAPKTVANFLQYIDEGFYDGVLIHRVVPGFVIQGGGYRPAGDELEKLEPTRPPVESEAPNGLSNIRATVAMALVGDDADSGDTQFFINLDDNSSNLDEGPPPFTVFAEVIDGGMDVVDQIAAVETGSRSGLNDVPIENVVMTSIRRVAPDE